MRRIRIGIYMLLAAGMTALWGACQRDDSPAGDTAEVTLRLLPKSPSASPPAPAETARAR